MHAHKSNHRLHNVSAGYVLYRALVNLCAYSLIQESAIPSFSPLNLSRGIV